MKPQPPVGCCGDPKRHHLKPSNGPAPPVRGVLTSQRSLVERRLRRRGRKCLWTEAEVVERLDEHALRAADCSYGLQPALTDPVVDGPARNVQQHGGLIDRHAASEPGFKGVHWGN